MEKSKGAFFSELKYVVERVRIELAYTRASLRPFMRMADPGRPTDDDETRINSVGNLVSKINDTIKEADDLLTKIK